mgnify:CR=1 FL=1
MPFRLGEMAGKAQTMLKKVLDAFVSLDNAAAHEVCAADGEIDAIKRDISQRIKKAVMENPDSLEYSFRLRYHRLRARQRELPGVVERRGEDRACLIR